MTDQADGSKPSKERTEALSFLGAAGSVVKNLSGSRGTSGPALIYVEPGQLDANLESVKIRHKSENIRLRKKIATASIWFVSLQLVCANTFFGYYLVNNVELVDTSVMISWMSMTVVEIIAILGIVARSLFPHKAKSGP